MFQSALAQAEELWDAASVAGPASRPLPLFYCLSQAGRAVCAAWTRGDRWKPRTHGLSGQEAPDDTGVAPQVFDYAAAVSGSKLPAFSMIAEATGSLTFKGTLRSPDSGRACPVSEPRTTFSATPPAERLRWSHLREGMT